MPRRDDRPLESSVEATFTGEAARLNVLPVKLGRDGWPDRMLLSNDGRVAFSELKREGEEPEPLQLYIIEELRRRGFFAEVVDTADKARGFFRRWLSS